MIFICLELTRVKFLVLCFFILIFNNFITTGYAKELDSIKITLLGTAGPEYFADRSGTSTLVEVNGHLFLFDAGNSIPKNIYRYNIKINDIRDVFLTHLHSDHIAGLADFWMTPWFLNGRDHGLDVWGPEGTKKMISGMFEMYDHDIENRGKGVLDKHSLAISTHTIQEGIVYNKHGVKITAFSVEHGDGNPAFGYKIENNIHAIVISGDTTYSDNLIKFAKGCDLIIQNVIVFSENKIRHNPKLQSEVLRKLTSPEQAAKMFSLIHPKIAVYSHIGKGDIQNEKLVDILKNKTHAAGYVGPLVVGEDGMVIEVDKKIKINLNYTLQKHHS